MRLTLFLSALTVAKAIDKDVTIGIIPILIFVGVFLLLDIADFGKK
jgi:hypothetical protein